MSENEGETVGGDDPVMVRNPYLAALRQAKADVQPSLTSIRAALDDAVRAMEANAWVSDSGKAEAFGNGLADHKRGLGECATGVDAEFDEATRGMPEEVESTSWYVHWRNV